MTKLWKSAITLAAASLLASMVVSTAAYAEADEGIVTTQSDQTVNPDKQ